MKYSHLYHSHIFETSWITDSNWRTLCLISLSTVAGSICLYVRIGQDAHPRLYLNLLANPPDDINSLNSIVTSVHIVLTALSIMLSIIVAILAYCINNCSNTDHAAPEKNDSCSIFGRVSIIQIIFLENYSLFK
jgi:hypothetical protein